MLVGIIFLLIGVSWLTLVFGTMVLYALVSAVVLVALFLALLALVFRFVGRYVVGAKW